MAANPDHEKGIQNTDSEIFSGDSNHAKFGSCQPGVLKTTHDGHTVLDPQPSSDGNDPLNWSQPKKTAILLIVSATAFLADFGSSVGAVTSVVQSNLL